MHKHGHHKENPQANQQSQPGAQKAPEQENAQGGAGDEAVKNVDFKAAAEAYADAKKQGGAQAPAGDETVEIKAETAAAASNEPDYRAIAMKTAAEFDNYRKRVAKEKTLWKKEALADFLKEFLPAFDDLGRAMTQSEKEGSFEVLRDGVALVRSNLWKVMEKAGVKEIAAHEKPFDPRFHEALTMLPVPGKEAGLVVEVFQPGYLMEDQVLRPSKVVVSAEPPQA